MCADGISMFPDTYRSPKIINIKRRKVFPEENYDEDEHLLKYDLEMLKTIESVELQI